MLEYGTMSPEQLNKTIHKLEQQMHKHAQNLEFEEAAKIRDQIHEMQEANMGITKTSV